MTKLQKTGLYVAIISAVLWFVWLCVWWYSSFGTRRASVWMDSMSVDDVWISYDANYFIYYALIVIFAVAIGLILEECSRKSLKKALIVLVISCLLWWLFQSLSIWFLWSLCWWCDDHIGYGFWILFLIFLVLWFVSLFFSFKYLVNGNKKWAILAVLIVCVLSGVMFICLLNMEEGYLLRGLRNWIKATYWLLFIVSITLCVIAWIKGYKEAKKSS